MEVEPLGKRFWLLAVILFLLLALVEVVSGQEIKLPEKVNGVACKAITIEAETDGQVKWVVLTEGLDAIPSKYLSDSKVFIVIPPKAGIYRILAYTAKGDVPSDPAICRLIVVGGPDAPPKPDDPKPVPPETDFQKRIRKAFLTDQAQDRVGILKEVWDESATLIAAKEVVTINQLFSAIRKVENKHLGQGELTNTRRVIWDELEREFDGNFILTTPFRNTVHTKVQEVVEALDRL